VSRIATLSIAFHSDLEEARRAYDEFAAFVEGRRLKIPVEWQGPSSGTPSPPAPNTPEGGPPRQTFGGLQVPFPIAPFTPAISPLSITPTAASAPLQQAITPVIARTLTDAFASAITDAGRRRREPLDELGPVARAARFDELSPILRASRYEAEPAPRRTITLTQQTAQAAPQATQQAITRLVQPPATPTSITVYGAIAESAPPTQIAIAPPRPPRRPPGISLGELPPPEEPERRLVRRVESRVIEPASLVTPPALTGPSPAAAPPAPPTNTVASPAPGSPPPRGSYGLIQPPTPRQLPPPPPLTPPGGAGAPPLVPPQPLAVQGAPPGGIVPPIIPPAPVPNQNNPAQGQTGRAFGFIRPVAAAYFAVRGIGAAAQALDENYVIRRSQLRDDLDTQVEVALQASRRNDEGFTGLLRNAGRGFFSQTGGGFSGAIGEASNFIKSRFTGQAETRFQQDIESLENAQAGQRGIRVAEATRSEATGLHARADAIGRSPVEQRIAAANEQYRLETEKSVELRRRANDLTTKDNAAASRLYDEANKYQSAALVLRDAEIRNANREEAVSNQTRGVETTRLEDIAAGGSERAAELRAARSHFDVRFADAFNRGESGEELNRMVREFDAQDAATRTQLNRQTAANDIAANAAGQANRLRTARDPINARIQEIAGATLSEATTADAADRGRVLRKGLSDLFGFLGQTGNALSDAAHDTENRTRVARLQRLGFTLEAQTQAIEGTREQQLRALPRVGGLLGRLLGVNRLRDDINAGAGEATEEARQQERRRQGLIAGTIESLGLQLQHQPLAAAIAQIRANAIAQTPDVAPINVSPFGIPTPNSAFFNPMQIGALQEQNALRQAEDERGSIELLQRDRGRVLGDLLRDNRAGAEVDTIRGRYDEERRSLELNPLLTPDARRDLEISSRALETGELKNFQKDYSRSFRAVQVDPLNFALDNPRDVEDPSAVYEKIKQALIDSAGDMGQAIADRMATLLAD
jgi:hypothetical protein